MSGLTLRQKAKDSHDQATVIETGERGLNNVFPFTSTDYLGSQKWDTSIRDSH
jgi:hypothetical protein